MTNQKEFDANIEAIIPEWGKAEEYIKIAEQMGGKVVFPSIKELRYAGRRVVDALNRASKGDYKTAIEYLIDAKFDCMRARHDAVDVSVSMAAKITDTIVDKTGYNAVLKAFPDYPKLRAMIIESQRKISSSRFDRDNREALYAKRAEAETVQAAVEGVQLHELVDLFRAFQANESVMKSIAFKERMLSCLKSAGVILALILSAIAAWPVIKEHFSKDSTPPSIQQPTTPPG